MRFSKWCAVRWEAGAESVFGHLGAIITAVAVLFLFMAYPFVVIYGAWILRHQLDELKDDL